MVALHEFDYFFCYGPEDFAQRCTLNISTKINILSDSLAFWMGHIHYGIFFRNNSIDCSMNLAHAHNLANIKIDGA